MKMVIKHKPNNALPIESLKMSDSLRTALRRHIIREREKIMEQEQADIVNKQKEEEEKRDNENDLVLLKKNKQQIAHIRSKLKSLRCEKHEVFQTLKRVLQDEENRRKKEIKEKCFPKEVSSTSPVIASKILHSPLSSSGESFVLCEKTDSQPQVSLQTSSALPFRGAVGSLYANSSNHMHHADPSFLTSFPKHPIITEPPKRFTPASYLPYSVAFQPPAVDHMLNLKRLYDRAAISRPITKADFAPVGHLLMPMNIANSIPYSRFCLRPPHQPAAHFQ